MGILPNRGDDGGVDIPIIGESSLESLSVLSVEVGERRVVPIFSRREHLFLGLRTGSMGLGGCCLLVYWIYFLRGAWVHLNPGGEFGREFSFWRFRGSGVVWRAWMRLWVSVRELLSWGLNLLRVSIRSCCL